MEMAAFVSALAALIGVVLTTLLGASRFGKMSGIVEKTLQVQNEMIKELKADISKLGEVVVTMAVSTTRLDNQGAQIATLQREVGDLRRGEGFIFPLSRSAKEFPGG